MIIRKEIPRSCWSKIDNRVIQDNTISDGAVRLYAYLIGMENGRNLTDAYIVKALSVSSKTLYNRKRELTKKNLILVEQIQPRVYSIYIGTKSKPASLVKQEWDKEEKT